MFFRFTGPRVLAHRGFVGAPGGVPVPENTAAAFSAALRAGADILETDVRASSDGVAVLAHDPETADPAVPGARPVAVARMTAAEQPWLPSLAGMLRAFPGARFNIDVKSADAVPGTIAAILAAGAADRVLVTSFSRSRRLAVLRGLPERPATSASAPEAAVLLLAAWAGVWPVLRRAARGLQAVQLPGEGAGARLLTPAAIRRLRAAGVEVHVWTINDPAAMRRWLARGVDGLVTDRSDLALAALGRS